MARPTLKALRTGDEHRPSFSKFPLGYQGISNRLSYGTEVTCRCGWSTKVNEPKKAAVEEHDEHLREVQARFCRKCGAEKVDMAGRCEACGAVSA